MGFIAWIVVGAIAGFLANMVVGSRDGLLRTLLIGIVGGIVGGIVATSIFKIGSVDGINIESIVIATLGAIAVLIVVHFGTGSRGLRHGLK
ncbi:MAG TPA: GlsB/YeaQ/YmgE family stress response membrane protein [Thermomicrobiaceae bacterium]|nr:GlsB/YeaQ/YmgE family stress response membrane protein [Thermomicrobiaceae bacterium]